MICKECKAEMTKKESKDKRGKPAVEICTECRLKALGWVQTKA